MLLQEQKPNSPIPLECYNRNARCKAWEMAFLSHLEGAVEYLEWSVSGISFQEKCVHKVRGLENGTCEGKMEEV